MGYFYFDETIHDNENFILGTFVYFERIVEKEIATILARNGFNPLVEEFKSRVSMKSNPKMQKLRLEISSFLHFNGKIGVCILPRSDRNLLGFHAIKALERISNQNNLLGSHLVYFDQGIQDFETEAKRLKYERVLPKRFQLFFNSDSKLIRGLQIADYAAHNCGVRLKYEISGEKKLVTIYEEDSQKEVDICFELFARIRCSFFTDGKPMGDDMPELGTCASTGLYLADECSTELRASAIKIFSKIYLGCIS